MSEMYGTYGVGPRTVSVDRSRRRCGWAECPNGQPALTVKAGIWQYETYVDGPGGKRAHTWLECCSAECLQAAVTWLHAEAR